MMTKPTDVLTGLPKAVPFVASLGITFPELTADEAGAVVVAELVDDDRFRNHLAGPHAGALFTLGETASGAVVLITFAELLEHAVPLPINADISFRKVAMGTVRATARLNVPAADVVAAFQDGGRPTFDVVVDIAMLDGVVTSVMTVTWTLRPKR